jgi:predicted nucleic acid-binding protein
MSVSFLDSNIVVYLFDDADAKKRNVAEALVRDALESGTAIVSFQVVQEVLNICTRKLGMTAVEAQRFLTSVLTPLWRIMPSARLYEHALELQARYRFSFYDALIVAGAIGGGCTRLYTEDLQHGQTVGPLVIENPFLDA